MKAFQAFLETWIPKVWGFLLVIAISAASLGVAILTVKWVLNLLGVSV